MKKYLIALLFVSGIAYVSCKKEKAATPTACFTVRGVDSTKVTGLPQARIDSIIRVQAPDYFITVNEGVPTGVYRKMLFFKNCSDASAYRVLYTGDSSHVYVADPANPGTGVTGVQSGVNFTADTLSYAYKTAGTYKITLITSNVADKGADIKRAVATKTIVLK